LLSRYAGNAAKNDERGGDAVETRPANRGTKASTEDEANSALSGGARTSGEGEDEEDEAKVSGCERNASSQILHVLPAMHMKMRM
jgi:hypothetical protein